MLIMRRILESDCIKRKYLNYVFLNMKLETLRYMY